MEKCIVLRQQKPLSYFSFDLTTLEENAGLVSDFGEEILKYEFMENTFVVMTKSGFSLFNTEFSLINQTPWPDAFLQILEEDQRARFPVIDINRNVFAYSSHQGLYYSSLEKSATPKLLKESYYGEKEMQVSVPYPVSFLPSGDLFMGHGYWEGSGGFCIITPMGETIMEFPTSGGYATGFNLVTSTGIFVFPHSTDNNPFFYNFETKETVEIPLGETEYPKINVLVNSSEPNALYWCVTPNAKTITSLYRIDLTTGEKVLLEELSTSRRSGSLSPVVVGVDNNKMVVAFQEKGKDMIKILTLPE